uniref:Uncharacterized protein n=1 Tax=Anabas testudineus TaxID=64144 RepID=A0AAQ6IQ93_ANATE
MLPAPLPLNSTQADPVETPIQEANITHSTCLSFANETIKAFHYLAANDKSHRLTLLKHEMALDYLLAKTGGICLTLNLTGEASVTLIPDNTDNITSVITHRRGHWPPQSLKTFTAWCCRC